MDKKELLYSVIEKDKDELFELLGNLIRINSENFGSHGNEIECAEFIRDYVTDLGYNSEVYSPMEIDNFENHPDYLAGRNLENRRNCTSIVQGKKGDKKLMIAAHLDTVEIGNPEKWDFPPLCGEVRDGNILGRGACDDKYGIATTLFLIKKMKELGIELDYDLLFTAYCDEEHGGSNGALAACLKYPCDDYFNLDCKNFEIWNCGVGGGQLEFTVSSKEPTDNCSKVLEGLKFAEEKFSVFRDKRREELEKNPIFTGTIVARNAYRLMEFTVGNGGGTDMDSGLFNVTYYTDKTEPEIIKELDALKKEIDEKFALLDLNELKLQKTTRFFHYVKSEDNNRMIDILKESGKENGRELFERGACLSDLPMFVLYGSPRSISFGIGADFDRPGGAHQMNEYVECDKLVQFAKIVGGVLLKY